MAQPPDIAAIIAALGPNAANGTPTPTSKSTAHSPFPPSYPAAASSITPSSSISGFALPQPTSSGNVDLSAVKPISSASSRDDPRARNPTYRRSRSRSRSPPRRDSYRDNHNPYRDERRDEHRRPNSGRDRSVSPTRPPAYSPTKPFNAARDRSPPPKHDDNTEVVMIEASSVGLVIGRSGENLRRVEQETGARVQFMPDNGAPFRQCKISGTARQREEAKQDILKVSHDNPRTQPSPAAAAAYAGSIERASGSASLPPVPREGEQSVQISVPDKTVGLIIGRGGETIRDLQERSGCHVNIVSESKSINGYRPVNLIGSPEAANKARELILEIVESDTRAGPPARTPQPPSFPAPHYPRPPYDPYAPYESPAAPKTTDSISVPSEAVGMIIGKGGDTIRDMQNSSGCKINVAPPAGADINRQIGLVGPRDAIEAAKRAILEKVAAVRDKQAGRFSRGPEAVQPAQYDPYSHHSAPYSHYPPPAQAVPPPVADQSDPYAAYGGYHNYASWWYSTYGAAQNGQPPGH